MKVRNLDSHFRNLCVPVFAPLFTLFIGIVWMPSCTQEYIHKETKIPSFSEQTRAHLFPARQLSLELAPQSSALSPRDTSNNWGEPNKVAFQVAGCASGYRKQVVNNSSSRASAFLVSGDKGCSVILDWFETSAGKYTLFGDYTEPSKVGEIRRYRRTESDHVDVLTRSQIPATVPELFWLPENFNAATSDNSAKNASTAHIANTPMTISFQMIDASEGASLEIGPQILPQISYLFSQSTLLENNDSSILTITASKPFDHDIDFHFTISGSAENEKDYFIAPRLPATLQAGHLQTTLELRTIDDDLIEGQETIEFTLEESPLYFSNQAGASAILIDDEFSSAKSLLFYSSSSLTSEGTSLRTWHDSSENGHDANQGTRKARPVVRRLFEHKSTPLMASFENSQTGMMISGSSLLDWTKDDRGRSIAFFAKTYSDTTNTQVVFEQGTLKSGVNVIIQNGQIIFSVWSSKGAELAVDSVRSHVSQNSSYHVVCNYDRFKNRIEIHLNGKTADSKVTLSDPEFKSSKIGLGFANGSTLNPTTKEELKSGSFTGGLFSFEIFSESLSKLHVLEHYQILTRRIILF